MRRPFSLPLLALAVLLTASCLDTEPFVPRVEDTNFDPSLGVDLSLSTQTASGLWYRDLVVGAGDVVPDTGTHSVNTTYALYLRTGEHLQSGTFNFTVGQNEAILGYDEGVRGMREGGQRQLIIPPHLGYGSAGSGQIPGNAIIIYTVDLTAIN
jgi:FKBP-type peptidyl-prolyl cis-trans isomerase FkpA